MNLCRAKTKDGKEVVGWYCCLKNNTHAIVLHEDSVVFTGGSISVRPFHIDPAPAAFDTGKDDKHGKRIFGSKGEFQGGDRVQITTENYYDNGRDWVRDAKVEYQSSAMTWVARVHESSWHGFADLHDAQLEIIPEDK